MIVTISKAIADYMEAHSNYDIRRSYLGMSKISGCPRRAYNDYLFGTTPNEHTYRMSFAGYEQERSIRAMLESFNLIRPNVDVELIAPFDDRLRGHIDGQTRDGYLVEIKSVSLRKYDRLTQNGRALHEHFVQCQLYMRYGGFKSTILIYRCRDSYEHKVMEIPYMESQARKFEDRARMILKAIDDKIPPACECNLCDTG